MSSQIDCSNVYISRSSFATDTNDFVGSFAAKSFKRGDLIEKGLMRRLSDNDNRAFDGMKNPYVFTWSDDIPNYTWAFGSGCSAFYNTARESCANTKMIRYYDEDRFEIYAEKDIQKDEELVHTYKSLNWRTVFKPLNDLLK